MIGSPVSKVWTEETIGLLKQLWDEGLSAALISDQIPGTTRNAVIGKKNRLKLSSRRPVQCAPKPRKERIVDKAPQQPALAIPAPEEPKGPGIPFLKSGITTCRSIEGCEVTEQGYTLAVFCSNPKIPESSFCPFHQAIYYRKDGR